MSDNQLTDELLRGVAHMCVGKAVRTYLNEFLPGGLRLARRELHARRERFEKAREILKSGKTALPDLGLSSSDLSWVADEIREEKDPDGLKVFFRAAADEMRKHEEAMAAEVGQIQS
ncbi:MAG: hypothetical protein AB201_02180 [Parcubacteria bacterium C7867-006]|nr:MAG: hypothetical protein AB201_02180 [Parcubacteria bacterium C7867-006]